MTKVAAAALEMPEEQRRFRIGALFQCTCCKKEWTSAHAWKSVNLNCPVCEGNAEVRNVLDGECELDSYHCHAETCEGFWQSIHDGKEEECIKCGESVAPDEGTLKRVGRHFRIACLDASCGANWEDFSANLQKTQRCRECGSCGDIKKTFKIYFPDNDNKDGNQRADEDDAMVFHDPAMVFHDPFRSDNTASCVVL